MEGTQSLGELVRANEGIEDLDIPSYLLELEVDPSELVLSSSLGPNETLYGVILYQLCGCDEAYDYFNRLAYERTRGIPLVPQTEVNPLDKEFLDDIFGEDKSGVHLAFAQVHGYDTPDYRAQREKIYGELLDEIVLRCANPSFYGMD